MDEQEGHLTDNEDVSMIRDEETQSIKSLGSTASRPSVGVEILDTDLESDDFDKTPRKAEDVLYSSEVRSTALSRLILFSILLFTVPFIIMYFAYRYLIAHHFSPEQASLYAGLMATFVVFVIVTIFVYIAYKEEITLSERVEEFNKKQH